MWRSVAVVGLFAAVWQAFRLADGGLWVTPDSAGYLTLALGFAERWDWTNPLLLFRLPGYPLLVAGVFELFGAHSAVGLRIAQHGMIVACACLTTVIAGRLGLANTASIGIGMVVAVNPFLGAYADAVLTEVPYTVLLLLWLTLVLEHLEKCNFKAIVGASLVAGTLTLFKDAGQFLLVITALAAIGAALRLPSFARARAGRRCIRAATGAVAPALVLLAPLMLQYHHSFGRWSLNCNGAMLPYYRAACVDRLDNAASPAVARIQGDLRRAQQGGIVAADATMHDYLPTVRAVQYARDPASRQMFASPALPEVAAALNEAGWDIIRAHPGEIARGTVGHVRHLLLTADDTSGASRGQYVDFVTGRVGDERLSPFMRLTAESSLRPGEVGNSTTRLLRAWARPLPLIRVSAYGLCIMLAILGAVAGYWRGPRVPMLLAIVVAAYHVVGAGFMGGLEPRYVLPVQPLMIIWLGMSVREVWRLFQAGTQVAAAGSPGIGAPAGRS